MNSPWKLSRIGTVLAVVNLTLSALWITIAFGNPWHQGLLLMMDFPAGYVPPYLAEVFVKSGTGYNVLTDMLFLIVGPVWYFFVGFCASKLLSAVRRSYSNDNPR
jgi:hypothetical protein